MPYNRFRSPSLDDMDRFPFAPVTGSSPEDRAQQAFAAFQASKNPQAELEASLARLERKIDALQANVSQMRHKLTLRENYRRAHVPGIGPGVVIDFSTPSTSPPKWSQEMWWGDFTNWEIQDWRR